MQQRLPALRLLGFKQNTITTNNTHKMKQNTILFDNQGMLSALRALVEAAAALDLPIAKEEEEACEMPRRPLPLDDWRVSPTGWSHDKGNF